MEPSTKTLREKISAKLGQDVLETLFVVGIVAFLIVWGLFGPDTRGNPQKSYEEHIAPLRSSPPSQ